MPVQTSPPSIPDSFPSFMSVFGDISSQISEREEESKLNRPRGASSNASANSSKHLLPFQHRQSVSSMTTGSSDSSPTTTISTFDSPTVPEISPSSSPESPLSMPLPYPNFKQDNASDRSSDVPIQRRPNSPVRRDRNLKNLSLRVPLPSHMAETTSPHHLTATPFPVRTPLRSARRKPANLTIRTPGFDKSFSTNVTELPPTPNGQHFLRHTESSPSLSMFSPSFGPNGGMQLPRPVTSHAADLSPGILEDNLFPVEAGADEDELAGLVLHKLDEGDELPDSRESVRRNERGYPNGPVQIYDSGVFLYLEPTAREASDFDVVINVAQEIANPFTNPSESNSTVLGAWRGVSAGLSAPEPQTAVSEVSEISFKSAFEYPQAETPKASGNDQSGPEYVHVGWDHNSEILDDLYPLCELIDSRVSQEKKVLIHCQLGVSRSASLVIAYGLYKNRDMDFNSVYGIVKERSRWVGPNMSLIYQLTDFRSRLLHGSLSKAAPEEWFVGGPRRSSEPKPSHIPTQDCNADEAGDDCNPSATRGQELSCALVVPSINLNEPNATESRDPSKSLSNKRSLYPCLRGLRPIQPTCRHLKSESNLRRRVNGPSSIKMDLFVRETLEEPPALCSPRTNIFLAGGPTAPNLAEDGPTGFELWPRIADPRSPPPGNERLIMRSIDEVL